MNSPGQSADPSRGQAAHDQDQINIWITAGGLNSGSSLIRLAQKLARDAERHALLSASLASQAERLMVAGLQRLENPVGAASPSRNC